MKHQSNLSHFVPRKINHILKIMKITALLFFLCVFSLFAEGTYPQQLLPPLNFKNVTLNEAFSTIEKKSNYVFLVTDETDGELNKKINLKTGSKPVSEVMDQILQNTNLTYVITNRQVAVYKKTKEQIASSYSVAQQKRQITGTVTDAETKLPVIGVSVWIKETTTGTFTDVDGKYSIPVNGSTGILVYSFVGYQTQEVPIGNKTEIDVQLSESKDTSLDEVVVVAYGQQKKESIIGAISTINADKLKTPASKISNVLAGQLAGIVSMNRSGEPGAGSDFYIRGISTFGSSKSPLVLVDGIERQLDLVDPEDIASFSILKDATATAVYGVRGANGVLLITTRKGKEGKPKISVRAETGMLGPTQMPKMVDSNQWTELYNEAYAYSHNGKQFYNDEIIQKYKTGSDPQLYPNVNWIDGLYKDWASNQRVNVNVSGGGSMVRYYVAGSLYNESSIFEEDKHKGMDYNSSINYSKVNFRANLDINVTRTTTLNVNLATVYEKKNSPGASANDIWGYSFATSPNVYPMKYDNGYLSGPTYGTGSNPYNLMMYSGYKEDYWNYAQSVIGLTQDFSDIITPGLKANIKYSYDALTSNTIKREFAPEAWLAVGRDGNGDLIYQQSTHGEAALKFEKSNGGNRITYLEASVNYDRLFDEKHRVGALLLFNQREKNDIGPDKVQASLPYRNQGLAGRITYSFSDKYFAEFNLGYNGSENFSPGKRFGFFPAGAIGWLVSNEKFWEPLRGTIDVLKLRVSYGIVGNDQIGGSRRFIYEETINTEAGEYRFNADKNMGGIQIGEVANPNVGWEEAKKTDIGIELNILKNIRFQGDYFLEKRSGIFLERKSIPAYAGVSTMPYINVGKMKNQGFDASLEADRKVGDVMLTGRANFTYSHNTVLDDDNPDYPELYRNRKGQRFEQYFGYQAIGFFRDEDDIANSPGQFGAIVQPGDIKYKDINGDGVINENDEIPMGYAPTPEVVYGFGVTAQWKGFDVSAFLQGVGRTTIRISGISFDPFSSGNMGRSAINEDIYKNRWHEGNTENALYPRVSDTKSTNNSPDRISTLWLRDGSFLRMKTVEFGYTLPKRLLQKTFIGSARIYITGVNLLTFSKFKLWDPERGSGQGADYPPNRTISLGVSVNI
jgi:TonB-linked SusC/RagA family outer membrane protein